MAAKQGTTIARDNLFYTVEAKAVKEVKVVSSTKGNNTVCGNNGSSNTVKAARYVPSVCITSTARQYTITR